MLMLDRFRKGSRSDILVIRGKEGLVEKVDLKPGSSSFSVELLEALMLFLLRVH